MTPSSATQPAALIKDLGISKPEDIDIEAIAQFCGAMIMYEPLYGCAARILGTEDRAIISVAADAPRPRQRFSAGHELGHWHYDRGRIALTCTEETMTTAWSDAGSFREKRANRYAADILLPSFLFDPQASRLETGLGAIRQLAATFETSLTATAIRFVESAIKPSVLVCSGQNRRRWFFSGRDVPKHLWPRKIPGSSTQAHDLLHTAATSVSGPTEVDADEWFDHHDAHNYVVMEESFRVMPSLILSLIWWKNERQLLDLEEDE
jgi:hypothetical protein